MEAKESSKAIEPIEVMELMDPDKCIARRLERDACADPPPKHTCEKLLRHAPRPPQATCE